MINKKVIIFDFDGTLGDTLPMLVGVYNGIAGDFGSKIVKTCDVQKFRNMNLQDLFTELNISKVKLPFLIKKCKKNLKMEMANVNPIEGVVDMIKSLKENGYTLGILTSNTKDNVEVFLNNNELEKYFDFIYSAKSIFGKDKVLAKILKKYDFHKDDVTYVGDEVRDIEASHRLGIAVIGVSWGFNSKKVLLKHNPNKVIDKPSELLSYMKTI